MDVFREKAWKESSEKFRGCTLSLNDFKTTENNLLQFKAVVSEDGNIERGSWGTKVDFNTVEPFTSIGTNDPRTATIEIIQLSLRSLDNYLLVTAQQFLEIFKKSKIDPCLLDIFNKDGVHDRQGRSFRSFERQTDNGKGSIFSFHLAPPFLGEDRTVLAWSFEPSTLETRAIFACSNLLEPTWLSDMVEPYLKHIWSPHFLTMVLLAKVSEKANKALINFQKNTCDTEKQTRHGHITYTAANLHSPQDTQAASNAIEELTQLSSRLAGTLTELKFSKSNLVYAFQGIENMQKQSANSDMLPWHGQLPTYSKAKHDHSTEEIRSFSYILSRKLDGALTQNEFLEQRATMQMTVIFNLLTHNDARSNLKLSEAMRRDSSSMKTVAIMTMMFLPGTFFSALLAMPSVKFPEKPGRVIQDGFALYWMLTISVTAAILTTWYVTTHPRRIVQNEAFPQLGARERMRRSMEVASVKGTPEAFSV